SPTSRRSTCRAGKWGPDPGSCVGCSASTSPARRPGAQRAPYQAADWQPTTGNRPHEAAPMPDVRPFRGVRYDVAQVGALSDLVAPPYDVIDADLQERLYAASPYNAIRLELNRPEPGDSEKENRYTRAAGFLRNWQRQGILRTEDHPALYP